METASFKRKIISFHNDSTFLCGLRGENLSEPILVKKDWMKDGENKIKLPDGTGNFEKRRHPRFTVDLPIEYRRRDLVDKYVRVMNASESGLSIYLSEQMEWVNI